MVLRGRGLYLLWFEGTGCNISKDLVDYRGANSPTPQYNIFVFESFCLSLNLGLDISSRTVRSQPRGEEGGLKKCTLNSTKVVLSHFSLRVEISRGV